LNNEDEMHYIDAHVHVWTNDFSRYPLAEQPSPSLMPVPHFGPETILGLASPEGVDRVVLIQMSFYKFDNRYMLDVIAAQPGVFRGVAVIDHTAGNVTNEMKRLRPLGVRGFRIYGLGMDHATWLGAPGYAEMFGCAAAEKLAVCPLINPEALPALDRMCERFPDTTIVVDHFARIGGGNVFDPTDIDALCHLSRHANVNVKMSAFYALGKAAAPHTDLIPLIRRMYDAFGPDRLMWASDCPFQSVRGNYPPSIALVRDRVDFFSADDRDKILRATAERVFFQ
jgi:predicted TIM-barrel fold metal-dependent hydrolase